MAGKALTAGADEVVGRIAGAVLAAIRMEIGPTQEELAEQLQVGLSTVQAWESGRRPLIRARFQDVQRLHRRLRANGAPPPLLHVPDPALVAPPSYKQHAGGPAGGHPPSLLVPAPPLT